MSSFPPTVAGIGAVVDDHVGIKGRPQILSPAGVLDAHPHCHHKEVIVLGVGSTRIEIQPIEHVTGAMRYACTKS